MTENERREREAFEAWAKLENHDLRRWPAPDGTYADSLTGFMWDAWKARASLSASTPSAEARETCLWSRNTDDDSGMYETTCRNAFQFNDGGLADNNVKFCLYCGKPAEEDLHSDDDAAMAPPADNKENGNG